MMRHLLRLAVLLGLGGIVLINDYGSLKGQYGGHSVIEASPLYRCLDRALGSSPHLHAYHPVVQGNLWSFEVFDLRVSDPLAAFSAPAALWATTLLPLLAALLLGRVFCGWVCPMGLLSEAVTWLRALLAKAGVSFFAWQVSPRPKFAILAIGATCSVLLSVPVFFLIYPPRLLSDLIRDGLVGTVSVAEMVFIGTVLLVELLFVSRIWCRCLCPGGALYALAGRWRLLRIRRDVGRCTDCGACDGVCPHRLSPSAEDPGGECDNCGLCRGACETAALGYYWSSGGRGR